MGFNVRRYRGKLLIKPSKAAVKRIRERLTAEMRALRGHNAAMVSDPAQPDHPGVVGLLPACGVVPGVQRVGHHMWKLTYKWAKFTHPHKSKRWIISRYFGAFNSARRDRWVFGDRDSGAYLLKFAWTKITRHTLVKGWASPDDPALAGYWAARRDAGDPRWTGPGCGYSRGSAGAARSAVTCCCTPTRSQDIPTNGNNGSQRPARRSPATRSPSSRGPGQRRPAS